MFRTTRHGNSARPTLFIPGSSTATSGSPDNLPACPPGIGVHPYLWSRDDVKTWLSWCMEEFALEGIDLEKFSMNGKALCMLKKPDFNDRAKNGDVLFNTLQQLLTSHKSSPIYMLPPHNPAYPGPHSPHRDGFHYDVMTPSSPHDLLLENPLLSASPPCAYTRQKSAPGVYRMLLRQNSQMLSRSPSPSFESPLDLSRDKEIESGVSGDEIGSGATEEHGGTNRLSVPTTPIGMFTPSQTQSRSPRSHSPGSRSPVRRPSPSGESLSPVPAKVKRLHSVEGGQLQDIPVPSSNFTSNYLPTPVINREPSPEHFHGLRQKFALTRLDSKDGHGEGQRHIDDHRLVDGQRQDPMRSSPHEEGECSEGSMHSESESPVEEGSLYNGRVKPINIVPTNQPTSTPESDGRIFPSQIPLTVNNVDTVEDCYDPDANDSDIQGDTKLLWEFIYQLLRSPEYSSLVRWEDEVRLVFRIINPSELARLWGLQKSRGNMTYEKLSRALRYYYKMNIIVKEPHRRLTYRFVKPPESIQRGQKGAKPGVSHKRRVSSSPTTSPSCSPTSTSPVSCSPSSSSPTQVPSISLTRPPLEVTTDHTSAPQNNEAAASSTSPQVPSPKPYSPITARAYYNLCRQYSMDNARVPWLVPKDSSKPAVADSQDTSGSDKPIDNDYPSSTENVEFIQPASAPNISLPFQSSPTAELTKHDFDNNNSRTGMDVRAMAQSKDDMIKQESLEFTISSEGIDDTKDHKASEPTTNNPI